LLKSAGSNDESKIFSILRMLVTTLIVAPGLGVAGAQAALTLPDMNI
jgi:hypothetical protein